jgi:hypothetical protein
MKPKKDSAMVCKIGMMNQERKKTRDRFPKDGTIVKSRLNSIGTFSFKDAKLAAFMGILPFSCNGLINPMTCYSIFKYLPNRHGW